MGEKEGESKHILHLQDLPSELWEIILINLAREDLPSLFITRFVCRKWYNTLKESVPLPPARRALGPRRPPAMRVMAIIARTANIKFLKWLREQGCPWDEKTFRGAARAGHLEILMWLKEMGCPTVIPRMMGRIALAKWRANYLTTHQPATSDDNNLNSKSVAGLISSEEELYESVKESERMLAGSSKVAAAGGHFKVLQWDSKPKPFISAEKWQLQRQQERDTSTS